MIKDDPRIKEYQYLKQLRKYMKDAPKRYIEGEDKPFIYPKQLEIHLPSDRQKACNLSCKHCFSTLYEKDLGRWESEALKLLHNLKGKISYHIFGGAYCEPTASPFLFSFLDTVKKYDNYFGIHTNGTYLLDLEKINRFLTNIHEISTNKTDYISISLDAGSGTSWSKLKRKKSEEFWKILHSIEVMSEIRDKSNKESHAIRVNYLASDITAFKEEFEFIISFAKNYKIDSLRFSVPYDYYLKDFKEVKKYKNEMELVLTNKISKWLESQVSKSKDEIPYIFWNSPFWTDIDRFDFDICRYPFFQLTLAADGYVYDCSSIAAPSASHMRKGKITSNLEEFNRQCWVTQNKPAKSRTDCFAKGLRCNRMGLEINKYFYEQGDFLL